MNMNVKSTDRFAMYLRKSRADIELEAMGEGETLARHESMLSKLAVRCGVSADQITIYKEIVSGDSISARPQMQKLLSAVSAHAYRGVFVVEIERLARGATSDQGAVADAFFYSKTLIITPSKTYDPVNDSDQEFFEFALFMSRREYKAIRRRMEAGKIESVKDGNYILSKPPFGYDIVRHSKRDRTLVINEEQAAIVRRVFDLTTVAGYTPGQIAKQLTLEHIPTPSGRAEWGRSSIVNILKNVTYSGRLMWGEYPVTRTYDDGRITRHRCKNDSPMIIEGKHPAIISNEQFEQAAKTFEGHTPLKSVHKLSNPLAGLLVCAQCGKIMRYDPSNNTRKKPYSLYVDRHTLCNQKSSRADYVFAAIRDALKKELEDTAISASDASVANRLKAQSIEVIKDSIAKEQSKRAKLYDAFESGVYSSDEFIQRRQKSDAALADLQQQLQAASAVATVDPSTRVATLQSLLDMLASSEDAAVKNAFFKRFIKRIMYNCDGTELFIDIQLH